LCKCGRCLFLEILGHIRAVELVAQLAVVMPCAHARDDLLTEEERERARERGVAAGGEVKRAREEEIGRAIDGERESGGREKAPTEGGTGGEREHR
jgi:hypothetical protein